MSPGEEQAPAEARRLLPEAVLDPAAPGPQRPGGLVPTGRGWDDEEPVPRGVAVGGQSRREHPLLLALPAHHVSALQRVDHHSQAGGWRKRFSLIWQH